MNKKSIYEKHTVEELKKMQEGLKDRIKRLEADLRSPLEQDYSEQAGQLSNRLLLTRLLEVEKENLIWIEKHLAKREMAI